MRKDDGTIRRLGDLMFRAHLNVARRKSPGNGNLTRLIVLTQYEEELLADLMEHHRDRILERRRVTNEPT